MRRPPFLLLCWLALTLSGVPGAFAQERPPAVPPVPAPSPVPPPPEPLPEIVATVDGEPISRQELERVAAALLNANGRSPGDLSPEERRKLMRAVTEELVTDRLVARESAGTPVSDAEVERRLKELRGEATPAQFEEALRRNGQTVADIRKNLVAEIRQGGWMESQIATTAKASDAETGEFYQANPDRFQAPETVRASHLLVRIASDAKPEIVQEKEKFVRSLRERIVEGKESFADLARQFSDDAGSREKGGDLGYFSRERMVPEFADAAFRLAKDEVSEPVRTSFGYHLIRLTDRRAPHQVSLEEARAGVKAYIESDRRRQAASQLIAGLHEKAKIEIFVP